MLRGGWFGCGWETGINRLIAINYFNHRLIVIKKINRCTALEIINDSSPSSEGSLPIHHKIPSSSFRSRLFNDFSKSIQRPSAHIAT